MAKDCELKRTRLTRRSLGQKGKSVLENPCVPPTQFLIANLELEFQVSPIRINQLSFSNRKFFAISTHSSGQPAVGSRASRHLPLAAEFLIETPRLKSLATPTKQSSVANSNRDKTGRFWSAFRRHSYIRSAKEPLCDSVPPWPVLAATLTLQAPPSNLAASCFVRALAGEHN
jgi:hypothetical protein